MLRNLVISNVALIERLELSFRAGLVVFTGETGAGKSILLDAFALILGERADASLIRAGADAARVEGLFDVGDHAGVTAYLEEVGVPVDDELVLVRELSREARNRCWVNGSLTTLRTLRGLGELLVDLHGQHDHQRLLRSTRHLALVDDFGPRGHRQRRDRVRGLVADHRRVTAELERSEEDRRQRLVEREHLEFQIGEIEAAELEEGEDVHLQDELKLLSGAETIREGLGRALGWLDGDEEVPGGLGGLERSAQELERLVGRGQLVDELGERALEQAELLRDLRDDLERALDRVDMDPERLAAAEARMQVLHRLTRKYGRDVDAVRATLEELRARRVELEGGEERREELEAERDALAARLAEELPVLSRQRRKLARALAAQVQEHLRDLAMPHATVSLELSREDDAAGIEVGGRRLRLHPDGLERAEIVVGTNPGEEPGPLAAIASGGELSRVMLGVKAAMARLEMVPIMVFDEIDAGVGGETGARMAGKLRAVSERCQCLCVTHLPAIAAVGGQHFRVTKEVVGERTHVEVAGVEGERREEEIARMLGDAHSRSGRDLARDLLRGGQRERTSGAESDEDPAVASRELPASDDRSNPRGRRAGRRRKGGGRA